MSGYKIDTEGLERLQQQFKAASRNVKSEYRKGLREIGDVVAEDARERVADYSPKTAASIKVRTRGSQGISVVAGSAALPIATLLEGKGVEGTWRHPLFGSKAHWYEQERHPYIWPAFLEKRPEVDDRLGRFIADAIRGTGLEVEDD